MSVLFKALQKAEKENEQRQTTTGGTGFDASRLAGSGAIKLAGGRNINWRVAGLAAAVVLAVAIGAAFFLVEPSPPARVAAVPSVTRPVPGATESIPVLQPSPKAADTAPTPTPTPTPMQQTAEAAPSPSTPAVPQITPATATAPPLAPSSEHAASQTTTAAPVKVAEAKIAEVATPTEPAKTAKSVVDQAVKTAPRKEKMPDLPADSPARMLNPPIAIQRAEFELSGVGKAVQVREVSQKAQDNVGAGYNALVRGAYDMALGFYDRALKDEPTSVLALLGRGAALQKLGNREEAHASYEKVLKVDPGNREALSNLTVILGERSPNEALTQLLDLEKQYPSFSPVKAQIGLTYAKMGSMPAALEYLGRAIMISPDSVMYQYNMALVLDHLGRREQAIASYETVLASLSGGRNAPELSSTEIERRVNYLKAR